MRDYPGKGLPFFELTFAEVKRTAYSPLYVANRHSWGLDLVSSDVLTESSTGSPLTTFFSFTSTSHSVGNHPRVEELLRPTVGMFFPPFQPMGDRSNASYVCRHWHRTL
jgi:hypothetical protein